MPPRRRRRRRTRTMPPRRNNASLPSYSFTVHHPPHSTWPWLSNANANRTSKREQNILIQILITEFDFQCQLRRYICTPKLVFTQCRTQIRYQLMTWGPKWLPSAEIREGWWALALAKSDSTKYSLDRRHDLRCIRSISLSSPSWLLLGEVSSTKTSTHFLESIPSHFIIVFLMIIAWQ